MLAYFVFRLEPIQRGETKSLDRLTSSLKTMTLSRHFVALCQGWCGLGMKIHSSLAIRIHACALTWTGDFYLLKHPTSRGWHVLVKAHPLTELGNQLR